MRVINVKNRNIGKMINMFEFLFVLVCMVLKVIIIIECIIKGVVVK